MAIRPSQSIILGNGLHDRCRRQTIPGNPPTKRIYKRISLRGQFLYLTVSIRLTILVIIRIGSAELNALQLIVVAFPPRALRSVAGGGFRNRRRCELQQRVLRCSQLLRSSLRPPQLQFRRFANFTNPVLARCCSRVLLE